MRNINNVSDVAFTAGAKVGAFKGAVEGLGNSEYHSLKSYWSSTDLKFLSDSSPAHFHEKYFGAGKDIKKAPTESMILGSMVHTLLLVPGEFQQEFFEMPELNLRTNEGKETRDRLLKENVGRMAYSKDLLDEASDMVAAAKAHPKFEEIMAPLRKELAFFWSCPFSNQNFRAKLDAGSSKHFVEVKTTESGNAHPDYWSKHAFNMNYDLSLVHYREGVKQIMGIELPAYFFIIERPAFVGAKPIVQIYKVGDLFWETGHHKWLDAVNKLTAGIQQKHWPSYFEDPLEIPEIQPPSWGVNQVLGSQKIDASPEDPDIF